jgi:hypothetical protein
MKSRPMSQVDGTRGRAAIGRGSGSALEELLKRERTKPVAEPARTPHRSSEAAGRRGRDESAQKPRTGDKGDRRP